MIGKPVHELLRKRFIKETESIISCTFPFLMWRLYNETPLQLSMRHIIILHFSSEGGGGGWGYWKGAGVCSLSFGVAYKKKFSINSINGTFRMLSFQILNLDTSSTPDKYSFWCCSFHATNRSAWGSSWIERGSVRTRVSGRKNAEKKIHFIWKWVYK